MDAVAPPGPVRPSVSLPVLRVLCARHRLPLPAAVPAPWVGATACVYPLGAAVLKVPHPSDEAAAALRRDVAVAALARAAGVATPRILAVDDRCDLLPAPYALAERIAGQAIARSDAKPQPWRALGWQLGLVHTRIDAEPLRPMLRTFTQSPEVDPRRWTLELAAASILPADDAAWLLALLDRLAPAALAPLPPVFCHGDVNAANVLVGQDPARPVLIDWAGAGWLDPVWDVAAVPLAAVPAVLAGHREVAPLPDDANAEARLLWCRLQLALDRLRHGRDPAPAAVATRLLAEARAFAALGPSG